MTTAHWHIHDAEGNHVGDVCGGTGRHYRVYSHWPGHKKYQMVGKPTKSPRVALRVASETMLTGLYNRVVVTLCADYYDPMKVYELVRS